jgi:hypothetical protein
MSTNHAITGSHVSKSQGGTHGRAMRVAIICASLVGAVLTVALLAAVARGVIASPTATTIDHVCVNKSSGQFFYLASCKKGQTTQAVTSTATQFKACYQTSNGVTRKVPQSTKCSNKSTKMEIEIEVPADSDSLYFCVGTDGTMYFKGTSEPTCAAGQYAVVIGPHNRAPTATVDAYSVAEDGMLNVNAPGVLSNDSDPDGDTITAELVDDVDDGTLTLAADGSLSYQPDADFNGTDTFTYNAKDSHGSLSGAVTVTITVTPVNDQPTDVSLSPSSVEENQPSGTTVGTLSSADVDAGDPHTYTLVAGAGDTDNGSFQISGSTFQTNATFDFEAKDTYSIRVKTDDGNGGTFEEQLTISITNANDAPTDVSLSNNSVGENQAAGTDVGTLTSVDQDAGDSFTYTLVSGAGDTNNSSFQISGNTLKTAGPLNFEDGATLSVRVRTSDGHGGTFEEQFAITINDANDAPKNLVLSNNTVEENQPSGTTVGTLSADDEDGDTPTFAFATGSGDDDNGSFTISGNTLKTNATFDFEAKDTYTIRVEADDGQGGTTSKQFTITITNANDAPTDIALSDSSVAENQPSGTAVGALSTTDQDTADTHTYSLVAGAGDDDNASFQITGDTLQTNATFDFEAKDSYTVRVQTDDGQGGTSSKQFTITITDANDAPTDIALSDSTVIEHQPSGTPIGTLSTTDPDSGDSFTYSLVSGTGDTDNASFQISGSELQTDADLAAGTYSVRVETSDGNGGTFAKQFDITVVPPNFAPTDIALSNNSVAENLPSGTDVGTLTTTDPDSGDTHTYTLVTGAGDADNASFQITGDKLQTNATFDFETKDTYTIRIRTDDGHAGGTFEEQFTITITDANDAPTDIALSSNTVAENLASGTDVGTFSSTDQDTADTHTYTLVTGTGDTDNASFQISGSTLKTNATFDFETKNSYSIRVQTSDGNGGTFQKQFTVTVTNANDAPTNLALSNSSVAENQPSGTNVGTLSTTDEDSADTHTYTLVTGAGDTDNASFQISGSTLKTNASFDFETKNSYTIRLQTSDGNGGTFQKQFTITVTNANDAPTDIALSKANVDENQPSGTPVGTFSTTDQDAADTHTYTLVTGTGDSDNASFQIVNGELRTNASFNFEAKNSYSVRVRTTDNGTPPKFFEEAFTISINDVNDAPVATNDSYSGAIGNTKASLGVTVTGEPVVALTGDVLKNNDTDEDATFPHTLSAVQETVSSTGGGTATINADGSFTFLPGVGDKNQSDTFTYHVTDGSATSSGTVTVGIADKLVWYVDNSKATNGDGRSSSPLNSLGGINGAGGSGDSDGPSDILFLYQGSGNYTGGLPLEASQQLIGQPNGLSVNNGVSNVQLVSPSGTRPTIANASGNGITLATGNIIRSVNVGNASGSGILGNTFGTLDVADAGVNTTGQALSLTTGTLSGSLSNVSSSGGTNNVLLSGVGTGGSTFDLGSGSLSGATSDAFKVVGGTGSFSYSGSVSQASSGAALVGVSGGHTGTLTFGTGTLSATGGTGLQFDNADGTYNFNGTTTLNGGDAGIDILNGSTGTFGFGTGTAITNPSGTAFNLSGTTPSNAAVTYSGLISKNNSGFAVDIDNHDSGTVTFQTETLSSTGTSSGIRVQNSNGGNVNFNNPTKTLNTATNKAVTLDTNNAGGTMNFGNGGLDIDTTSGAGFSAAGGGTITVTGTGNSVSSMTGRAVNVQNTNFGSSGFTFQSISANGAPNGILLNSTGTSAGMTITGTGANNSGGSIQNTTSHGVSLTTTNNFNADELSITGANFAGVDGTDVTNFTFTDGEILNAGDSHTDNLHGAIAFNDQAGNENNIDGTLVITGNLLKDPYGGGVDVFNRSGTITDATVSNNTIDSPADEALSREDAISFNLFGSATTVASLTKAQIQNNVITDFPSGNGIAFLGAQTNLSPAPVGTVGVPGSATNRILIDGNLLTGDPVNRFGGAAILAGVEGRGAGNFDITNNGTAANPITNVGTHAIATGNSGSSNVEYLIEGNRINANNFEAGGLGIRSASDQHIMVGGSTLSNPTLKTIIHNNVVRNTTGGGIRVLAANSNGTSEVKVTNNDVADGAVGSSVSAPPIAVENGSSAVGAFTLTMCATISGNTTAANVRASANVFPGILLAKRNGQFGITGGLTPSPAPNATTEAFLTGLNPNSSLGAGFYNGKRVVVNVGDNLVSCTHPAGF